MKNQVMKMPEQKLKALAVPQVFICIHKKQ